MFTARAGDDVRAKCGVREYSDSKGIFESVELDLSQFFFRDCHSDKQVHDCGGPLANATHLVLASPGSDIRVLVRTTGHVWGTRKEGLGKHEFHGTDTIANRHVRLLSWLVEVLDGRPG